MQGSLKIEVEQATANSQLGSVFLTMDLQHALPTLKLSCGPAFYKHKVWTYNFNVHNCVSDQRYMFMWDEDPANRGSDKIGSCILKFIEMLSKKCMHLVICSKTWLIQNSRDPKKCCFNYELKN
jgi:hypothetical protein